MKSLVKGFLIAAAMLSFAVVAASASISGFTGATKYASALDDCNDDCSDDCNKECE